MPTCHTIGVRALDRERRWKSENRSETTRHLGTTVVFVDIHIDEIPFASLPSALACVYAIVAREGKIIGLPLGVVSTPLTAIVYVDEPLGIEPGFGESSGEEGSCTTRSDGYRPSTGG